MLRRRRRRKWGRSCGTVHRGRSVVYTARAEINHTSRNGRPTKSANRPDGRRRGPTGRGRRPGPFCPRTRVLSPPRPYLPSVITRLVRRSASSPSRDRADHPPRRPRISTSSVPRCAQIYRFLADGRAGGRPAGRHAINTTADRLRRRRRACGERRLA